MTQDTKRPVNLALELALLVILAAIWSTSYTFIKIGVATIPPLTLIAVRTLIAGLALLAIMWLCGIALPRHGALWRRFLMQACLNSAVPFTLIAWAEQSVDAGLAVILNSTTPIFTFLITIFITRHERVTVRTSFGVAAGLAGVTLIVGVGALDGLGRELLAQLAVIAATVCYAGAAIFGRNFKGLDPIVPAAGSLIAGAMLLMPLSLVVDQPWTLAPSRDSILALVALAIVSTAIPFVLYFRLMQTLGPVRSTAQAFLRVPFGVAIGGLALGESLSWSAWIGLVCVIVGVGAMTLGPVGDLSTAWRWPVRLWRAYRNRAGCAELLHLDDEGLRDLGLTRWDVRGALAERWTIDPSSRLVALARHGRAAHDAHGGNRLAESSHSDYL